MTDIPLPALKENVEQVEVNAVLVKPGDVVTRDQSLLEVQADKAALEVPSPLAGKIAELRVKAGDQIKVGYIFAVIEAGEASAAKPAEPAKPIPATGPEARAAKPTEEDRWDEPAPVPVVQPETVVAVAAKVAAPPGVAAPTTGLVPAGPATRRLARELGIDLRQVRGSGRNGRVTEDDIKAYVARLAAGAGEAVPAASSGALGGLVAPALPRFEDFGPVDREALSKVRQLTARQMSLAWSLIPHVTQHDEADITDLEAFRKAQSAKGPKLTVTAFALKACAIALKQFPAFNASLDLANNQLVLKKYYHIGVAVDTDKGLVVPVIRDVDRKSVEQLAIELNETAEKARTGKFDMSGGTFTISNLGGIGGTGFTPIVNWPEVAILGISRSKLQPTVHAGQIAPRLMMPLSLSYDHRVLDGAAAARFTRLIADLLENPWMMALKS